MLEQFHPTEVLELAVAEANGFGGVMVADHFQPWTPRQGQASFVWNVLSALEQMARMVTPAHFEGRLHISADPDAHRAYPDAHRAYLQGFLDLGVDRTYLHNVGRNQREFLEVFGRDVLPGLNP